MVDRQQLVMIPGLLCSDELFADQSRGLAAAADVHVGRVLKSHTLVNMARAILHTSPPKFALAGLSLGGYVAYEILRQAPERVTRLALLGANARADRPDQIKLRELLIGLAQMLGPRNVQAAALPMLIDKSRLRDRALVDRVLNMADVVGRDAFIRQQRAIIARPDNRAFLAEIACPTTIIVGDADLLTPLKVAEELHEGIRGSSLHVIPDCGHLSTMEQPDPVNAVLREWLATA
ncbi:MAG: alpha/beta fold hydrolase [Hyphomicrobiaceae bacterium]